MAENGVSLRLPTFYSSSGVHNHKGKASGEYIVAKGPPEASGPHPGPGARSRPGGGHENDLGCRLRAALVFLP